MHAAELYLWLGPPIGALSDEHGEWMQKLFHEAYRKYSSKGGGVSSGADLLGQLAAWLSRYAAMKHGERTIALANADLVRAARLGLREPLQKLLDRKLADAHVTDDASGRVPMSDALVAAVANGHAGCAHLLLARKADTSARGVDGQTALMIASRAGDAPLVAALLASGAALEPTWCKLNAIQWANFEGKPTIAGQLRASTRTPPPCPDRAPAPRVDETLSHLLPPQKGAMRWLDLTHLRAQMKGGGSQLREWRQKLKVLSHQLEYSLRVHCNGGDEGVALSSLPNLPQDSLMLDVRPGIIMGAFDSGDDDTVVHEATTDCFAPSRLRRLRRKQRPRVSLDGNHRETPHFVSVKHANKDYDVYIAQVELTFRFQKIDASTASTTIEELALVRWMDDAPTQEDLGELHTEPDKPDQRMPLEEVLRQIDRKVRHTYTPANRERDQSAHD